MTRAARHMVLAIDLGSSSFRSAVFKEDGSRGTVTKVKLDARSDLASVGSIDPATLVEPFLAAVKGAVQEGGITDVVISSQWHTLLGVDEHDRPQTPLFTWESSASLNGATALASMVDSERYRRVTGSYPHPSYPVAAILTSLQEGVKPFRWTDLASWLVRGALGVEAGWSAEMAAGSGLWDQATYCWDTNLCKLVAVPGGLGPIWSQPSPIPATGAGIGLAGALVHPTMADGICSNFGLHALGPESAALSLGTSGSIRFVVEESPQNIPFGLWRYSWTRGLVGIGGAGSNVGNVLQWIRDELLIDDPTEFAWELPPDWRGLAVVPLLAGERGPGYRSNATGAISGIDLGTTRYEIAQEMVLGSVTVISRLVELADEVFPRVKRLIASGGVVAHMPGYVQLIADATRRSVVVPNADEETLTGAFIRWKSNNDIRRAMREPNPSASRVFRSRQTWSEALSTRRTASEALATKVIGDIVGR